MEGHLLFLNDTCDTGPPFPYTYVIYRNSYRIVKADGLYFTGQRIAPTLKTFESAYSDTDGCYDIPSFENYLVPAITINEGALPFDVPITLPFDIRVK